MTPTKLLISTLTLATFLGGTIALAQGHDHHAGSGKEPATAGLKLKDGKKWQTDPALREGMAAIRGDVAAVLGPVHSGKFTPEQYAALAKGLEGRAATIISKCKLPPEVDAQLHLVLADLYAGTAVMKAEGDRMSGVVKVIGALDAYATHFEHAGWKRIQH